MAWSTLAKSGTRADADAKRPARSLRRSAAISATAMPLVVAMRRRTRLLKKVVPDAVALRARAGAALFTCTFDAPGLTADAVGIEATRFSRRWSQVAMRLRLPSLTGFQQGRRLVGSLLLVTDETGLILYVQPSEALATNMVARVAERCVHASAMLSDGGVPMRVQLLRPGTVDAASLARLAVMGCVVAGRPARWLTDAIAAAAFAITPELLTHWVAHAPTPLSRLFLVLAASPRPGHAAELSALIASPQFDFERALAQCASDSGQRHRRL